MEDNTLVRSTRRRSRKSKFVQISLFSAILLLILFSIFFVWRFATDNGVKITVVSEESNDTNPQDSQEPLIDKSTETSPIEFEYIELEFIEENFHLGIRDNLAFIPKGEALGLSLLPTDVGFSKRIIADNFNSARSVHAVDIDLDGDKDILGAAREIHQITLWYNQGLDAESGEFNMTKKVIDDDFKGAFSVHAADLDSDGYFDVIGASLYDEQIAWWRNNKDGSFSEKIVIDPYFDGAIFVYSADVDGDGLFDVLAAGEAVDQIAWWRNLDNAEFSEKIIIGDNFVGARSVHAVDLDGDLDIDILGTARFEDQIAWWENKGDGYEFIEHILDSNFRGPRSVHGVDIDSDGDMDIIGAARYAHQIVLWENDGAQNFNKIMVDDRFEGATNVYSSDINRDGKKDIVAAAVYANDVAWWQNLGEGKFIRHVIENNFLGATFVYVEDINGDGFGDIIVPSVFDNSIGLWTARPQFNLVGIFESSIIRLEEETELLTLNWEAAIPEKTSLSFQIRSAESQSELENSNWFGPEGGIPYYTVSGTQINQIHNGKEYIQFRIKFETESADLSPTLFQVSLRTKIRK